MYIKRLLIQLLKELNVALLSKNSNTFVCENCTRLFGYTVCPRSLCKHRLYPNSPRWINVQSNGCGLSSISDSYLNPNSIGIKYSLIVLAVGGKNTIALFCLFSAWNTKMPTFKVDWYVFYHVSLTGPIPGKKFKTEN